MNTEENIITIHNRDIDEANKAFADFMLKMEHCFNERSAQNPLLYKNCSSSELEKITEQILIDVCPSTPFRRSDIKLVAGHTFPDIMTSDMYGVEVKSTNKDKWTSTGSSIVESTRSEFVERIYMLFGSLGSNPPAFKCKPYQECLSSIAVTHSPRYLIDMNLSRQDNIFAKMRMDYDSFRLLDEETKITKVRQYYRQKAQREHKSAMPWWMGEATSVNLSFYNDLTPVLKEDLTARTFILFPSVFAKNASDGYKDVSLWLCNRYSLLCYNMRDAFSAGGKLTTIDGYRLKKPYPQVVKRLLEHHQRIERLLQNPDDDILLDIKEYWDFPYNHISLYSSWLNLIKKAFLKNPELKDINIVELLITHAHPY
ncbi:MAG: hypothetical protein IKX36_00310 [Prevotella sp.]|nr:hypothetical protein [Prevotella sp.]